MLNTHAEGTLASSSTPCASSANTSILYGPDGASDSPMPRLSNVMISRLDVASADAYRNTESERDRRDALSRSVLKASIFGNGRGKGLQSVDVTRRNDAVKMHGGG